MNNYSQRDRRAAIVCSHVAGGEFPICRAVRDEPDLTEDSGWQFLCGQAEEEDPDKAKVWLICEVMSHDPTLCDFMDLPSGSILTRENDQEPWKVSSRN